jgi:formylmethanofuran dehydrogenase subunit A
MAIKIQGVTVISDSQELTITGYANFSGTGALKVPVGTDAERPTAAQGQIRYNTTQAGFEGYNGTEWAPIGGGADEVARTLATLAL